MMLASAPPTRERGLFLPPFTATEQAAKKEWSTRVRWMFLGLHRTLHRFLDRSRFDKSTRLATAWLRHCIKAQGSLLSCHRQVFPLRPAIIYSLGHRQIFEEWFF